MTWQRASVIHPCPALVSRELLFPRKRTTAAAIAAFAEGRNLPPSRPTPLLSYACARRSVDTGGPPRHTGAEQGVLATKAPLVVAEFLTGARDPSRLRSIP